jgi:hypothetical protein
MDRSSEGLEQIMTHCSEKLKQREIGWSIDEIR